MAKLEWDKIDERVYETGIDRGVLYFPNEQGLYNDGVAWNGLTGVDESFDEDSEPIYFDGVKFSDNVSYGDFAAKMTAYTYPDEFLDYEGTEPLGNGLYVDDQQAKRFGLSYRTMIESGVEGYQLHLLYNLTASISSVNYQNGSDSPQASEFSRDITGVPNEADKWRPTCHIIVDSTVLPADLVEALEGILYGDASPDVPPRLPSFAALLTLIYYWDPRLVVPDSAGGLAQLVSGFGDLTSVGMPPGFYSALPDTRLMDSGLEGLYILETA